MQENNLSKEFIIDRFKEIVEESLFNEKEQRIESYMQEIAILRADIEKYKTNSSMITP